MPAEIFSRGYHNSHDIVYRLSSEEKHPFPEADLVKVMPTTDRHFGPRVYLKTRLANFIFPGTVIDVVGQAVLLDARPPQHLHYLYSKLAPVHPSHAQFSSHSRAKYRAGKEICDCANCGPHYEYHQATGLDREAKALSEIMAEAGIDVPFDDPTDYCRTGRGPIFFEVDGLDTELARAYIIRTQHPGAESLFHLLERYDDLMDWSCDDYDDKTSACVRLT